MITIQHIDTCLSCYISDWHDREGEWLFGVYVDGATTYADIYSAALDEIKRRPERVQGLSQEDLCAALNGCFENIDLSSVVDSSLYAPKEYEDCDEFYLWFLVTWPAEDNGGRRSMTHEEKRRALLRGTAHRMIVYLRENYTYPHDERYATDTLRMARLKHTRSISVTREDLRRISQNHEIPLPTTR